MTVGDRPKSPRRIDYVDGLARAAAPLVLFVFGLTLAIGPPGRSRPVYGALWVALLALALAGLAAARGRGVSRRRPALDAAAAVIAATLVLSAALAFLPWPMLRPLSYLLLAIGLALWAAPAAVAAAIPAAGLLELVRAARAPGASTAAVLLWTAALAAVALAIRTRLRHQAGLEETLTRIRAGAQAVAPLPEMRPLEGPAPPSAGQRLDEAVAFLARFEAVVDGLLRLLQITLPTSHRVLLYLADRTDDGLRLQAAVGQEIDLLDRAAKVQLKSGLLGWLADAPGPRRLAPLDRSAHRPEYEPRAGVVRALLTCPIRSDGGLEALLVADAVRPEAFTAEAEERAALVGRLILAALNDLREQQRSRSRALEFSSLLDASRALGSKLDLRHRLETMADKARDIVPYDQCLIFLVDAGERRARLMVARGLEPPAAAAAAMPLADGLISMIVRTRQPLLLSNRDRRHGQLTLFPPASGIALRPASFLGLPMVAEERVIGILALAADRPGAFDAHHRDFMEALCYHAALSIADAELHDRVARLATTDGLTGLANHRRFQERLTEEFDRQARYPGTFSLVMLDVDHFKGVNDRYGHLAGDAVLRQIAAALQRQARRVDLAARYGGEEFMLLLANAGRKEAFETAERLRRAIEAVTTEAPAGAIRVSVSLGVATYPDDARDRTALIELADRALYAAKRAGRNRTVRAKDLAAATS
jgi:diguanylate cyclase (GGDEF)-like protein